MQFLSSKDIKEKIVYDRLFWQLCSSPKLESYVVKYSRSHQWCLFTLKDSQEWYYSTKTHEFRPFQHQILESGWSQGFCGLILAHLSAVWFDNDQTLETNKFIARWERFQIIICVLCTEEMNDLSIKEHYHREIFFKNS